VKGPHEHKVIHLKEKVEEQMKFKMDSFIGTGNLSEEKKIFYHDIPAGLKIF